MPLALVARFGSTQILQDSYVLRGAPRLQLLTADQLSTSLARQPRGSLSQTLLSSNAQSWRAKNLIAPSFLSLAAHSRLASTTTTQPAAAAAAPVATTPPPPAAAAAPVDTTTPTDVIASLGDPSFMGLPADQVGYLHSIGIDYGWGITSTIQWTLEHIHIYSGMPWWGTLVTGALVFRLVAFPLFLKSSDASAKQQALQPIMKPITDRMHAALKERDQQGMQQAQLELQAVYARAKFSTKDMFIPAALQAVLGFCSFRLLRAMANLPVPEWETGGFGWITDLSVSDPYFILPVVTAGSLHLLFRLGGETGAMKTMSKGMRTVMLYVMPSVVLFSMSWLPAGLALWFTTTGITGIAQARLLQREEVRKFFNLSPLPNQAALAKKPEDGVIDVNATSKPTYQAPTRTPGAQKQDPAPAPANTEGRSRVHTWIADQINDVAESMYKMKESVMDRAESMANPNAKPVKTKSALPKDYLEEAKAYEARFKKEQKEAKKERTRRLDRQARK